METEFDIPSTVNMSTNTNTNTNTTGLKDNGINDERHSLAGPPAAGHHEPLSSFVILLTVTAAIGGFLFGYDTGVISGAMLLVEDDFDLTDLQEEVVVSITVGAAAVASLVGGPAMQHWGRRPVILFAGAVFTIGAILLAAAQSYEELVVGRLIVGIGIGFASLVTPVYIAEAAPAHLRGRLVTLNTLFITGGQVIAGIVAGSFSTTDGGWRYMLGLSGIPSILLFVGFLFLPESPRWLVSAGKRHKAMLALKAIRGVPDVDAEIEELVQSATEQGTGVLKGGITVAGLLRDRRIRRALVLGCGLQLLQQLCGINTLMYYSATIVSMAGFGVEISIWMTAVTATAQSLGVVLGLHFIEVCGRRKLVLTSLSLVVASLVCLGTGFFLYDSSPSETHGWLVVAFMMIYLFTFGTGLSSVPWAFNAEVYPTHARSLGTSASTTTNWIGNALVSATFLTLADSAIEKGGTFMLYAIIGVLGWAWLFTCMPETKGLALEEVEQLFTRDGDPSTPPLDEHFLDGSRGGADTETLGGAGGEQNSAGAVLSENQHRADGFAPLRDDSRR